MEKKKNKTEEIYCKICNQNEWNVLREAVKWVL